MAQVRGGGVGYHGVTEDVTEWSMRRRDVGGLAIMRRLAECGKRPGPDLSRLGTDVQKRPILRSPENAGERSTGRTNEELRIGMAPVRASRGTPSTKDD